MSRRRSRTLTLRTLALLIVPAGCGPDELPAFANPPPPDAATASGENARDASQRIGATADADAGADEPSGDG